MGNNGKKKKRKTTDFFVAEHQHTNEGLGYGWMCMVYIVKSEIYVHKTKMIRRRRYNGITEIASTGRRRGRESPEEVDNKNIKDWVGGSLCLETKSKSKRRPGNNYIVNMIYCA